jgi:hypothetical protein
MEYNVTESIGGMWVKASEVTAQRAKLVSEAKPMEGKFGSQDVAKIQFEGSTEPLNINLNKTNLLGLVKAFGTDSNNWIGKVLSVEKEQVRVSGRMTTAIYLIPEGFKRINDENGYTKIVPMAPVATQNSVAQQTVNDVRETFAETVDAPF